MMTLDNKIREKLLSLVNPQQLVDDEQPIVDEIEAAFVFSASKIDWDKTLGHQTYDLGRDCADEFNQITAFIQKGSIDKAIEASDSLIYINDSSMDFAVKIKPEQFYPFLKLALDNIPQHHYFFEREAKWCLVISMEGDVDFGFSPNTPVIESLGQSVMV